MDKNEKKTLTIKLTYLASKGWQGFWSKGSLLTKPELNERLEEKAKERISLWHGNSAPLIVVLQSTQIVNKEIKFERESLSG